MIFTVSFVKQIKTGNFLLHDYIGLWKNTALTFDLYRTSKNGLIIFEEGGGEGVGLTKYYGTLRKTSAKYHIIFSCLIFSTLIKKIVQRRRREKFFGREMGQNGSWTGPMQARQELNQKSR